MSENRVRGVFGVRLPSRRLRVALDDSSEGSDSWPRCDVCGLPGIYLGADLVDPKYRCPRCCDRHGDETPLVTHILAEGSDDMEGCL